MYLHNIRYIVPAALFRMQRSKNAVEEPRTKPIVLLMITGSYFRRRRRLTIFERDETIFATPLNLLS